MKSKAIAAFLTVCVVWGTTYLGIAVALETIPVLLVAGLRWMSAGLIMSAFMLASGPVLAHATARAIHLHRRARA